MTERIDRILKQDLFKECLEANRAAEAERCFCRHDMVHFLDVARIGRILALEEEIAMSGELIYAAALLHDIGRFRQYSEGVPHEQASAAIASELLEACGFEDKETAVITDAILQHRNSGVMEEKNLRGLLYRADKLSRPCFSCGAEAACNWKETKKNLKLKI